MQHKNYILFLIVLFFLNFKAAIDSKANDKRLLIFPRGYGNIMDQNNPKAKCGIVKNQSGTKYFFLIKNFTDSSKNINPLLYVYDYPDKRLIINGDDFDNLDTINKQLTYDIFYSNLSAKIMAENSEFVFEEYQTLIFSLENEFSRLGFCVNKSAEEINKEILNHFVIKEKSKWKTFIEECEQMLLFYLPVVVESKMRFFSCIIERSQRD